MRPVAQTVTDIRVAIPAPGNDTIGIVAETAVQCAPPGEDGSQLACVAEEFGRALDADGILVVWHGDHQPPTFMFSSGDCERDDMSRVLTLASNIAASNDTRSRSSWNKAGDGETQRGVLTTAVAAPGGLFTISTLFRHLGEGARQRCSEAAARVLPFIEPFFRVWTARLALSSRARALTAVVDKTDLGIVLVDRTGHIGFANPAAERLLAARDGVSRSGGRLVGNNFKDTLAIQAAIDQAGRQDPADRNAKPVVALNRAARRPLLATAVVADPLDSAFGDTGMTIVYLVDAEQEVGPLLEPACRMYGLSPIETRLTCLIADGKSLAVAATALRVREMTARSYLKQIFQKTATNRQAELVWLMLKSAVRTAPEACTILRSTPTPKWG